MPMNKDFMIGPQRDRAFSWDLAYDSGIHTDGMGNPLPVPDLSHLMHFPMHHQSEPEHDSSKLTIRAKFPTKPKKAESVLESLPSIKKEVIGNSSLLNEHDHEKLDAIPIDHFDLESGDDDDADEFFEDPLLLSIPPELLIDNGTMGPPALPSTAGGNPKRRSRSKGSNEEKGLKKNQSNSNLANNNNNNAAGNNSNQNNLPNSSSTGNLLIGGKANPNNFTIGKGNLSYHIILFLFV